MIEEAAYRVLVRDGYKAASILAIAKEAKASNETLYRWYGNKQGLFAALVERNAQAARELLDEALAGDQTPLTTLEALGPVLLRLVTSERAVALNRAAAGDVYDTGTLGAALAKGGREALLPLIAKLLAQADAEGALQIDDPTEAAEIYINLLLGDVQIRRATGALEPLEEEVIVARSTRAMTLLRRLYAPS
jgi:AcrR family transcriptional regulator